MPDGEPPMDAQLDPSYRAWLGSKPIPGEVFVDTGEASAMDRKKLLWTPTRPQREMIKEAISHETDMVNKLFMNDDQKSYSDHIQVLVGEALRDVKVDPVTLKSLPEASPPSNGEAKDSST